MRAAGGHAADSYESPMVLRIVMVCAMAGMFMQTLDQTIANVALPHMQGSLAASRDQITWVKFEKLPHIVDMEITIIEKLSILEMADGSRIEGIIPIDRPQEQSRLSDVLNDPRDAFIRIDDEEDTYYVNKRFIRLLIPR